MLATFADSDNAYQSEICVTANDFGQFLVGCYIVDTAYYFLSGVHNYIMIIMVDIILFLIVYDVSKIWPTAICRKLFLKNF